MNHTPEPTIRELRRNTLAALALLAVVTLGWLAIRSVFTWAGAW
jgi:hypothetical protein